MNLQLLRTEARPHPGLLPQEKEKLRPSPFFAVLRATASFRHNQRFQTLDCCYLPEAAIFNAISATRLPTPRTVLRLPSSFESSSPCDCMVPPQWSPGLPSPTRTIPW